MQQSFFNRYKGLVHGVAFIPLIMTILFTLAAVILTGLSETGPGPIMNLPSYLKIEQVESSRVLLGSILTGMIALTVFGFSMMIIVVNQAASVYSPKVVDTLLGERYSKLILGFYLGTIIFTIITLMHLDAESKSKGLPHFAVLTNIVLQILSILLFISLINLISNSVRITRIIENIYRRTKRKISLTDRTNCIDEKPAKGEWVAYPANMSGYFQMIRIRPVMKVLGHNDLAMQVVKNAGGYFTCRTPVFKLNKKVSADVLDEIRACFVSYPEEIIEDNEFFGFRQLTEIAVKALSPGVNDPGVARLCIDYIGDLLSDWMESAKKSAVADENGVPRLYLNKHNIESLLAECVVPIKVYGKRDYTILSALLNMLLDLSRYDPDGGKRDILTEQALALLQDVDEHITNSLEKRLVLETAAKLNASSYFNLPVEKLDGMNDRL